MPEIFVFPSGEYNYSFAGCTRSEAGEALASIMRHLEGMTADLGTGFKVQLRVAVKSRICRHQPFLEFTPEQFEQQEESENTEHHNFCVSVLGAILQELLVYDMTNVQMVNVTLVIPGDAIVEQLTVMKQVCERYDQLVGVAQDKEDLDMLVGKTLPPAVFKEYDGVKARYKQMLGK